MGSPVRPCFCSASCQVNSDHKTSQEAEGTKTKYRDPGYVCSAESRSYLVAVACAGIAEPLDVVEDEPGEGDDHEDDEGDGDEHDRRPAHVLLQVAGADGDVQGDHDVPLQQGRDLTTFRLWNHDGHDAACACTHTHTHREHYRCLGDE